MPKGLTLTLLIGLVPMPAPKVVVDALASAQVTVSATDRSGFQLQFKYGKESPIVTTMIPTGYFDPGTRVILIATVNGIPNVLMDGIITRQDIAPSNTPSASTLTLTGEDIALQMSRVDLTGIMPYPAMPPSVRVLTILARYAVFGVIPMVIPSPFDEPPLPTNQIPTQQGTDYDYVKKLAADTGYVFYVEPGPLPGINTAYWGPEIRIGMIQPALNINMDRHTNVESLTFNYNGLQLTQLIALIQQRETRVPIPIPVPDLGMLAGPLGAKPVTRLKVGFLRDIANLSPMEAMAKILGEVKAASDAITGTGALDVLRYGTVLKARQLVGVRGAGIAYDGLYYVKTVTHNLKPGEFKQQFTLARNGTLPTVPAVPA